MKANDERQRVLETLIDWNGHPGWTGFHVAVTSGHKTWACDNPDPVECDHGDLDQITILRPKPPRQYIVDLNFDGRGYRVKHASIPDYTIALFDTQFNAQEYADWKEGLE